MLATIDYAKILDQAEKLSEMILQCDVINEYYACLNRLKKNEDTQRKIKAFVKAKEKFEEVQRFGKYHPDYFSIMKEVREVKREMDLDVHVARFKKAENDVQTLLDEISLIIGRSVSENVKVPTGNPFFDTGAGCNGGCGSGGSCGCAH